jgi:hypothetical protein
MNFFFTFRTDCIFSPDDRMVVTGLSVKKGQGKGKLLFMDRQTLDTVTEMEISDTVRFYLCSIITIYDHFIQKASCDWS